MTTAKKLDISVGKVKSIPGNGWKLHDPVTWFLMQTQLSLFSLLLAKKQKVVIKKISLINDGIADQFLILSIQELGAH